MEAARRTPLYAEHLELGGRMVSFGGWQLPQQYSSIRDEHLAVRTAAGLFDLSHMGRVEISGPSAEAYLQYLYTNDLAGVEPGRAQYTLMCQDEGGILDDLVVYRHSSERFTAVINASNAERDLAWMQSHAFSGVTIADRTAEVSLIALQGPKAQGLLPASGIDLAAIPYFGFDHGEVAGAPVMLSRTGYTGEDGFEIFVAAEQAPLVWRELIARGREGGVLPCGLGARDACRLEAALRLYGNDMDEQTSPYEAGLGWTVKLGKGDFVGKEALRQLKLAGPSRRIVGLRCQEGSIPRHGCRVLRGGRQIGKVTSGTHSFWLKQAIAMASLQVGVAAPGTEVGIEVRGATVQGEVVALPFYRGSAKSPAASGKA